MVLEDTIKKVSFYSRRFDKLSKSSQKGLLLQNCMSSKTFFPNLQKKNYTDIYPSYPWHLVREDIVKTFNCFYYVACNMWTYTFTYILHDTWSDKVIYYAELILMYPTLHCSAYEHIDIHNIGPCIYLYPKKRFMPSAIYYWEDVLKLS